MIRKLRRSDAVTKDEEGYVVGGGIMRMAQRIANLSGDFLIQRDSHLLRQQHQVCVAAALSRSFSLLLT